MKYCIEPEYDGMALKTFLLREQGYSHACLTALKKREDGLLVNGLHVTVRYLLRTGDVLTVGLDDTEPSETIVPTKIPLSVLYEDTDYIVLNKAPYLPTHPSHGHFTDTLANGLVYLFQNRGVPFVFRACSRLDRDTSGVVAVAKNKAAAFRFYEAHQSGTVQKVYLAVLNGHLESKTGVISAAIARENDSVIRRKVSPNGAEAVTEYEVLDYGNTPEGEALTLVRARPITGRTHQLRVHFSHCGTPILGDFMYGTESAYIGRQALHAAETAFPSIEGKTVKVCAPLPEDMKKLMAFFSGYREEGGKENDGCK